jgi:hypothetical protein
MKILIYSECVEHLKILLSIAKAHSEEIAKPQNKESRPTSFDLIAAISFDHAAEYLASSDLVIVDTDTDNGSRLAHLNLHSAFVPMIEVGNVRGRKTGNQSPFVREHLWHFIESRLGGSIKDLTFEESQAVGV